MDKQYTSETILKCEFYLIDLIVSLDISLFFLCIGIIIMSNLYLSCESHKTRSTRKTNRKRGRHENMHTRHR